MSLLFLTILTVFPEQPWVIENLALTIYEATSRMQIKLTWSLLKMEMSPYHDAYLWATITFCDYLWRKDSERYVPFFKKGFLWDLNSFLFNTGGWFPCMHICVPDAWRARRRYWIPGNCSCESLSGCWELNPVPVVEESTLLTTEPGLRAHQAHF